MNQIHENWKKEYSNVPEDQTLKLDIKSPENFIDDVKLNYILPFLSNSGIVVEIGAGSGRLLTRIALEKDIQVIGIDFESSVMIRNNIRKFNLDGIAINGDAYHIPIKSEIVDVVFSGGLLEHFNENEILLVIDEMYRILKPNGLFFAEIVPKKFSLCRPIILKDCGGYENSFNKKDWKNIIELCNFEDIKVVSGLVIPPNFYELFRSGIQLEIIYKLKNIIKNMDNTIISDVFGFSYYITARK